MPSSCSSLPCGPLPPVGRASLLPAAAAALGALLGLMPGGGASADPDDSPVSGWPVEALWEPGPDGGPGRASLPRVGGLAGADGPVGTVPAAAVGTRPFPAVNALVPAAGACPVDGRALPAVGALAAAALGCPVGGGPLPEAGPLPAGAVGGRPSPTGLAWR